MGKVLSKFLNGYAGEVSRSIDDIIESFPNGESTAIAFGAPVAFYQGAVKLASATYTDVIGIAIRAAKTEKTYAGNDPEYGADELVDVLKRGTVVVEVPNAATPAAGGTVYITKATGKFAVAADSTNTIEMAGWKFKGAKDENNMVEIVLTERKF